MKKKTHNYQYFFDNVTKFWFKSTSHQIFAANRLEKPHVTLPTR